MGSEFGIFTMAPDRNLLYEPGGQPACSTEYPACSTDYIHGACHVTSHRVQSYVIGGAVSRVHRCPDSRVPGWLPLIGFNLGVE